MFLYIHVPFCESKCKYCRFASTWNLQKFRLEKYVDFITSSIKTSPSIPLETSPSIPLLWEEREVEQIKSSIYFWWGTPWVLSLVQLEKILSDFTYDTSTEITLETTPNKITRENILWWQKLWINRISMWVQSLNNKTLKEIGREDKWDILKALDLLENIIENISIDFIIGLPYVKKWWVKRDIGFLLEKYDFIQHVSVYMLEDVTSSLSHLETSPSIPLLEEREVVQISSPSPQGEGARGWGYPWNWEENSIEKEDYLDEYIEVKEFLEKKGFYRYEISNFAKPLRECRHNMSYWNHSEVRAIWLWASWYEKWERYSFPDNFKDFYAGNNIFREKLTKNDIFTEKVMFQLRTSGLIEKIYKKLNQEKIEYFIKEGYLFLENKKLKLTDKWILVLDYILREI